jgi:hypothetical protein
MDYNLTLFKDSIRDILLMSSPNTSNNNNNNNISSGLDSAQGLTVANLSLDNEIVGGGVGGGYSIGK